MILVSIPGLSTYDQENTSRNSWNREWYVLSSNGEQDTLTWMFSTTLGLVKISIEMVSSIFDKFHLESIALIGKVFEKNVLIDGWYSSLRLSSS